MSPNTDKPVRIYTTPFCGYCVNAKRLLDRLAIGFEETDVSRDLALRQKLVDETQWRTVPMIFVEDKFIGGYDDLYALWKRGGLKHLEVAQANRSQS